MHFFLAQDLFYEPLSPDEDEFIEIVPTKFSHVQELLKNGEIIDAKTALGIILAGNFLQQEQVA
jgi:ADP-ribose pyrophosphatase